MSLIIGAIILVVLVVILIMAKKVAKIAIKGIFMVAIVIGLIFLLSKIFPNSGLADATAYMVKLVK